MPVGSNEYQHQVIGTSDSQVQAPNFVVSIAGRKKARFIEFLLLLEKVLEKYESIDYLTR